MALINRQTLKNYFQKGGFATEKHFVDLIDSSLNVVDDGISINQKQGLKLNPLGSSTIGSSDIPMLRRMRNVKGLIIGLLWYCGN